MSRGRDWLSINLHSALALSLSFSLRVFASSRFVHPLWNVQPVLCTPCVDRRTGLAGGPVHLSALVERGEGGLVDEYRSLLRLFDIRGTGGCVKRGNSSRLGLMILMMGLSRRGETGMFVWLDPNWSRILCNAVKICNTLDGDLVDLVELFEVCQELFHLIKHRQTSPNIVKRCQTLPNIVKHRQIILRSFIPR